MKYTPDPKLKWKRKTFDEKVLRELEKEGNHRKVAEIETSRDLVKDIEQLVCDVHEETHTQGREPLENIACAQKRMVSLMARVAITNDKLSRKIYFLTLLMTVMTLAIVILTIVLVSKEA